MLIFDRITTSAQMTEELGAEFAEELKNNGIKTDDGVMFAALYGDLGAGKTAFVRGMASVIAPAAQVFSPTYTVVNEYRSEDGCLCHCDMYRISDEDDLMSIGFYDYTDCVIAAEWCENIPYALPDVRYEVRIEKDILDDNKRRITVERVGC